MNCCRLTYIMNLQPIKKVLIVLFIWGTNILNAQNYFPPILGNNWDTLNPDRFGYCLEKIDSLNSFNKTQKSKAFILIKDGKIVIESYYGSFTRDSFWYWASAGKTLTAAIVGILEGKGNIRLTDPTSVYLGKSWTSLGSAQEDSITVWNQLTMTSGLDDAPPNSDCTNPSCLKFKASAGTRWAYHNAPYTLLDGVISSATGKTINQVINSEITLKSGIKVSYVYVGDNNVAFSTPRNFAKFGLLLLNKGKWDSEQVIPPAYFDSMISSSQPLNLSYGFLTWLNGRSSFMVPQSQIRFNGSLIPEAPSDLFMALGKNGQQIHVVPSQNLIWIRMGESPVTESPLVSFDLGRDIWRHINNLKCNSSGLIAYQKKAYFYPNPVERGGRINILHAQLIDKFGRVYEIKNGVIPTEISPGVYSVVSEFQKSQIVILP